MVLFVVPFQIAAHTFFLSRILNPTIFRMTRRNHMQEGHSFMTFTLRGAKRMKEYYKFMFCVQNSRRCGDRWKIFADIISVWYQRTTT